MNGAETLVRTLLAGGVDVCFANPGTSEMHFVAALDHVPGMRCVLCLFEGVVTGAADGYARMAEKPAATLLHLGPGMANGLANMHNAKKARTPMVNIVGDHATYHLALDAPLTADIEGAAEPFSHWVHTGKSSMTIGADGAAAIAAAIALPGQIATLILPADTAWLEGGPVGTVEAPPPPAPVAETRLQAAADALLSGEPVMLLLGNRALRASQLEAASRIANKTGARLLAETSNGRIERGAGRVAIERLPYPVDQALDALAGIKHLILIGSKPPVAFFAYPNKPGELQPTDCEIHRLAEREEDIADALDRLVAAVGATETAPTLTPARRPALPKGQITPEGLADTLGALLPDNAVICDESITTGRNFFSTTASAPQHDWLQLTGGAIGEGMPMAIGAAIACADRQVICLQADGSGMYTVQALWTMAREKLKVLTLIWSNRAYQILRGELANVGALNPGRKAIDMLSLDNPAIDWVKLANGMGVAARTAQTLEELQDAFREGLDIDGPFLVEVIL